MEKNELKNQLQIWNLKKEIWNSLLKKLKREVANQKTKEQLISIKSTIKEVERILKKVNSQMNFLKEEIQKTQEKEVQEEGEKEDSIIELLKYKKNPDEEDKNQIIWHLEDGILVYEGDLNVWDLNHYIKSDVDYFMKNSKIIKY